MTPLRHRPYGGATRPFTIGMRPLDPGRWFEPDERFATEMAEKQALFGSNREMVFRYCAGSEAAQQEVWALLSNHLPAQFPNLYSKVGQSIALSETGQTISPSQECPPLLAAAQLVQDDLCILQRDRDEWQLTAAALCFPSTWSLAEKIGRPMSAIHQGVPDFAGQMQTRVARIFDNLRPETPVKRFNWSIYTDNRLHHPETRSNPARFAGRDLENEAFIRVERQTLHRLPMSGAILFTIRVYVDPLSAFRTLPEGGHLAASLAGQLAALTPEQAAYKGLAQSRADLVTALRALAGADGE